MAAIAALIAVINLYWLRKEGQRAEENLGLLRSQEQRSRKEYEKREDQDRRNIHEGQAREIHSWVARDDTQDGFGRYVPDPKLWIAVSNGSNNPVYETIVVLNSESFTQHWAIRPIILKVLPPGLYFFPIDFRIRNVSVDVKILFKDRAGNSWKRDTDGSLIEIEKSPLEITGWAGATIIWSSPSIDKLPTPPAAR
ncbi:MAG: hypothetical protein ACYC5F_00295 [Thermoleophilia bacterium]